MSTPLSLLARKGRMSGLRDAIDLQGGEVLFYTNLPPVSPDTATLETLLGILPLGIPCGVVGNSGGFATLTFVVPQITLAVASGFIGWLRVTDGNGAGMLDLLCGLPGSGQAAIINAVQVFTGGEIRLTSCVFGE